MTVSLGELLLPVVEFSGLVEEEDKEEGSFKEQYGQEEAKLNIACSDLWSVNISEQSKWFFICTATAISSDTMWKVTIIHRNSIHDANMVDRKMCLATCE